MRQVSITCFAFLITLNTVLSLTRGRSNEDRDEIYTTKLKQREIDSQKRLLGTITLQKPAVKKWTVSRADSNNRRGNIDNEATFGSNDQRFKLMPYNNKRVHGTATNRPLRDIHGVDVVDQPRKPTRSSLHKKVIARFKEELSKRMKVKPRQEIEFLEDNQRNGARQDESESPQYEEVTESDNSDNRDQNGFSNNYVTVIDNIDGKDTDPYSTLNSDEAKNEYTNVENSIGEGANEESQLLGKEVNDVLGALTKEDSRLNQVGVRMPQAHGELPSKQAPSSFSDNGGDVNFMNLDKEGNKNFGNRATGDVTVIEDNEDVNPNGDTPPILSKPVWDVIQQVQKNFTDQDKIDQSTDGNQMQTESSETYSPTNFPMPGHMSEGKNVTGPGNALKDLETTLKMFAGSNTQSADYHDNTAKETENIPAKGNKQKLVLTGSAEEGEKGTSTEDDHPPMPSLSVHFDYPQNGNTSNVKLYWNGQNEKFAPKPASNSSLLFNNVSDVVVLHSDSDNLKNKPWNENVDADKVAEEDQSPEITTPSGSINDASSNSNQPANVEIGTSINNSDSTEVHSSGKIASDGPLHINVTGLKKDHGNVNNFDTNPWIVNATGNKGNQNPDKGMYFPPPSESGNADNGNSGQPGITGMKRPTNDFASNNVHLNGQSVNDPNGAEKPSQAYINSSSPSTSAFNSQTEKVPQGTTTPQDDIIIIEPQPVSLKPLLKVRNENKTVSSQGRLTPENTPNTETEYTFGSQSNENLALENGATHYNGFRQGASTFPWKLGTKDASPYQIDKPSTLAGYKSENQTPYNSRQHEQGQSIFPNRQDNEQNQQQMEGFGGTSKLGVPLQVNKGNHSLESWSKEYQSLKEKLTDLYGQAHGNSSQRQGPLSDAQQTMKEDSSLLPLSDGRESGQEAMDGGNGMFFKDLKGDVKVETWGNTGQMNTNYLPYFINKDRKNDNGAHSRKLSVVRFQNLQDVVGNVRSIPMANQTLVAASNSSNLKTEIHSKNDTDVNHTEYLENELLQKHNDYVNFVKQRLASRLRSTDSMQLRDTSDSLPPVNDGPSSHQVLMSYFGNETDLRKRLHPDDNSLAELQNTNHTLKGQGIQLDSNSTTTGTESIGTKAKQFSSIRLTQRDGNYSNSDLLKHAINSLKGEREQPLTKYLEEFINLMSSDAAASSNELNRTTNISPESESSSSAPKSLPTQVMQSEASKKENVTDLKNRVIIVVSPKSLRDLMKNRSHNSSQPAIHKGTPVMVDKAKNSSMKVNPSVNETVTNIQVQSRNASANTTIQDQVQNQPPIKVANDSSNEEKLATKAQNDNLDMLYRDELKSLEISLSRDFMSSWIYYQRSFGQMGITPSMLRSGIANLGSPQRLKKVFKKALAGTDLNVLVVGGSISAGGGLEKDRGNVEGVYHKAFSDWWNNTVTPITASQLKIDAVAIGGTDSEYFSYCVKNYMRTLPDIVIWELAANDYKRYDGRHFVPAKPLEQLIRIILSLPSNPALILANFFRGNYYKTAAGQDCPDSEDEGGKSIAQYYKLTSLSWRNVICSQENSKDLDLKKLFSSDGYHPSLLGHAQMSALLISYVKGVFEQTISQEMISLKNRTLEKEHIVPPSMAGPMYDDPVTPRPLCWTLLTPDYDQKLRNTLPDLEFTEATGFQFANISHWPIRRDRLRCLKAIQPGAMLKMKFIVPSSGNQSDYNGGYKRELAVTTHNSFGGAGTLWLDGNKNDALIIEEETGQRRTQNDVLTRKLTPGLHTLTVYALQPGFCLSAVAVL